MPVEDRGTHGEETKGAAVRSLYGIDGRRRRRRRREEDEDESLLDLAAAEQATLPEPPQPQTPSQQTAQAPPPPPEQTLVVEGRRSMVRSFKEWWHEESLARAAEKRARATAEAIMRAQAIQAATRPVEKAPTEPEQNRSIHSVLALTEERFQVLGIRSERIQDELTGM